MTESPQKIVCEVFLRAIESIIQITGLQKPQISLTAVIALPFLFQVKQVIEILQSFQVLYNQMKKFKLQSVIKPPEFKPTEKLQAAKPKGTEKLIDKMQAEKQKKKQQLEKQMKMLQDKINEKDSNVKEAEKMLNIDEFLKKQKEKTKEYALKLNEEYQKQKKERQVKLYKKYNRGDTASEKLMTINTKNQIPLNVVSAMEQLKQSQPRIQKWILDDHHHKLGDLLLDVSKNDLFSQELRIQEEKCLKGNPQNSWKRIKEVSTNSAQTKYLPVEVEQNQLQPSDMGESLMSALSLMPKDLSQYLYSHQTATDKEEYFLLKLYPGGEKKSILTDERIQVREYTHKFVNVNSRHKNGTTFWSTLLQKTYKKCSLGKASNLTLPEAMQVIYGLDAEIIPFSNQIISKQNFATILSTLLSSSPKTVLGFINDRCDTSQRIYPLAEVQFPLKQKKKKKKDKTQEQIPHEILYKLLNPYTGVLKSDNLNKFTINQLYQKYNKIIVLRQYPEKWCAMRLKMEFLSNGPITFTSTDWIKNNQYSFTISRPAEIRMALRRSWGLLPDSAEKKEEEKLLFGFILFKSPEGQTEISTMKLQNLVVKCKSNDENGCIFNKSFQKGTYIIIPYSHLVSQQYTQSFNLDIMVERDDILTMNKAKIYQYFYENKPANDDKVIQKLQSRVKYERPKLEKIALPRLSFHQNRIINEKYLQSLGLILPKEVKISQFLIPGKLKQFLVQGQVKQSKKEKRQKKSQQDQDLDKYEREQALKILLGYDALQDQDINHGEMMSLINETTDQIDLADYHLGEEGVMAIMDSLMSLPRITKLDLSNNDLNDSVITYLCYYLQKGSRKQLRELNLTGNPLGKTSTKALKGLKSVFEHLTISGVKL